MDNIHKFQGLLKDLFQFDAADLDFGIYRIMNYKRGVIERFIQEDLPRFISEELAQGALAGQTKAATELETFKKKVLEALGDDALDATGKLSENYHKTKAGKEYLAALEKAKSAKGYEALEAENRRTADGESVTHLEHHLRQYTRRNTSDFFIHKDLKGFLSRELDFYLKNEVLNLEEMEAATEGWKEKDYKKDKEFVAAHKLTAGMDEVYVNGDSYIPGARVLEKLFKEQMFSPVEV